MAAAVALPLIPPGHGHVRPSGPDSGRARCGGPALCAQCHTEELALAYRIVIELMLDACAKQERRTNIGWEGQSMAAAIRRTTEDLLKTALRDVVGAPTKR